MLSFVIAILSTFSVALEPAAISLDNKNIQESKAYTAGVEWAKKMMSKDEKEPKKSCCQAKNYYEKAISHPNPIHQQAQSQSDKILIFVSFSMPDASLKALASSLSTIDNKSTLMLRGLVDNDFKKTALKIKELETEMEINPSSFEEYKVTQVPTFILVRDGKEVARLSGNVTLEFASNKLREGA